MTLSYIKPCPFCGCLYFDQFKEAIKNSINYRIYCRCRDCGARSPVAVASPVLDDRAYWVIAVQLWTSDKYRHQLLKIGV